MKNPSAANSASFWGALALFAAIGVVTVVIGGAIRYSRRPPQAVLNELMEQPREGDADAGPLPPDYQRRRYGGNPKMGFTRTKALSAVKYFSNWRSLGPRNVVSIGEPRMGRVNCITADPSNPNKLFVGAAAGGVWISLDAGQTWTPHTDDLPVLGVSSIVVDPKNPSLVYIATGDADDSNTPSIGVYKSVDGGTTWVATGLTFPATDYNLIYRLAINPTATGTIYAAARGGVYATTDGAANWHLVNLPQTNGSSQISWYDVKFAPGNPSTIYAIGDGARFYRSTDGGGTWQQTASGLPPLSGTGRCAMAVSAAEQNSVYLLCTTNDPTDKFIGVYRSTNGGTSFAALPDGGTVASDFGGNSWYNTCLAASPTAAGELYVAGTQISHSLNHGSTWQSVGTGTHVDVHDLEFINNTFYACTDGGVHRTTDGGAHWTDLSSSLVIGQIYAISATEQDAALTYTGEQDNGFDRLSSNQWANVLVGDYGNSIIDPTNENIVYAVAAYNVFLKTTDGWNSSIPLQVTGESCGFVGPPLLIHPTNPQVLYAGYQNVWRTSDGGSTWSKLSNFADASTCVAMAISPSNPSFIYASRGGTMVRTQDGGVTWNDITNGLPTDQYTQVQSIAIDPANPSRVWVALNAGGSDAVYSSTQAGGSWTNVSGSLPNVGARTIVYEKGSNDGIYVGMSNGVYYRDAGMQDWQPFMTNLPQVIVDDLKIEYSTKTLRAGTYGRGLWESPLASVSHPAFFTGEVALSNGVYYLAFPNGNLFGYYAYLSDPRYLYHFDLGYEYVFDAADGHGGVYFYDFKSGGFFYTSPSFSFPFLYDFALKAVLYYYPDPTNPQRYNTNGVRYFYNFATGKIITK